MSEAISVVIRMGQFFLMNHECLFSGKVNVAVCCRKVSPKYVSGPLSSGGKNMFVVRKE